jgi:hypothetical protein
MQMLGQSNRSSEQLDAGWVIEQIDTQGIITARKGNFKRHVFPGEFLNDSAFHQPPAANAAIRMIVRKEHKDPSSGFYYAFSNTLGEDNHDQLVRLYFNIKPEGAATLLELVTGMLNEYRVPFTFKCLQHTAFYTRCDAAVLYFEKRYCTVVFHLLPQLYKAIKMHLKEETPLFTKALAKGLGFAENPLKQDESFGTHCSKMIAQGIMQAYQKNMPKLHWADEIKNTMEQRHFYTDIDKLYLNPASRYPYSFPELS